MLDLKTVVNSLLVEDMPLAKLHLLIYFAQGQWMGETGEKLISSTISAGPDEQPIVDDLVKMFPQYKDIDSVIGKQKKASALPERERSFIESMIASGFFKQSVDSLREIAAITAPFAAARAGLEVGDPVLAPIDADLMHLYFAWKTLHGIHNDENAVGTERGLLAYPVCVFEHDGCYLVQVPQFPDINVEEDCIEEALESARNQIILVLLDGFHNGKYDSARALPKSGMPLPKCTGGYTSYILIDFLEQQLLDLTHELKAAFSQVVMKNLTDRGEYTASMSDMQNAFMSNLS